MIKINRLHILIIVFFAVISNSCHKTAVTRYDSFSTVDVSEQLNNATDNVTGAEQKVADSTVAIRDDATSIKRSAEDVNRKTPVEARANVRPHLSDIVANADDILKNANNLEEARGQLGNALGQLGHAGAKITELEKEYERAKGAAETAIKERDAAVARERDAIKKLMRWLIGACVIGFGIGVVLMFFKHFVIGGAVIGGSLATMILAITVQKYIEWIAIGGLVIILLAVAYFAYQFFVRNKAIEEVVRTTEVAKRKLSKENRAKLFGKDVEPGVAYQMQSSSTERLVEGFRKKMKPRWEPTVNVPDDDDDDAI